MMATGISDPAHDHARDPNSSITSGENSGDAPVYRAREGDTLFYVFSVHRPAKSQLDGAADAQFDDADEEAASNKEDDVGDGWELVKVIPDAFPFSPILHEWGRGLVLDMDEELVGLAVGDKKSLVRVSEKAKWNPFEIDLPVEALDVDGDFHIVIDIVALIPQDATFAARLHPIQLALTTGDALHGTCHDPTSVLSRYMLGLTLAQHLAADLAGIHDDAFQPDLARTMTLSLTLATRAAAAALALDKLDGALALLVDFFAAVESPETSELGKEYTAPLPGGALLAVFGRLEVERFAVEAEVVTRAVGLWCECLERMGEAEMAVAYPRQRPAPCAASTRSTSTLTRAFAPYTLFPVPSVVAWCLTNYPALRPWLNDQPTETTHRLVARLLDALFTAGALRAYATVKSEKKPMGRPAPRGYAKIRAELRAQVSMEDDDGDEVDDDLPPFTFDDAETGHEELLDDDDDEEEEGDATTVLAMADAGTYYKFCTLPHASSPRAAAADLDSAIPTAEIDLAEYVSHLSYAPMQAYRVDKVWNYLTNSHAGVQTLCAWIEAGRPDGGVADSGVEEDVGMVRRKKKGWVPTLKDEQVALRRKIAGAYLRRMVEVGRASLLPKPVPGAAWKVCLMLVEDVESV
ncbi:hypothetical protein AMAG_18698 [Allomyces macrogynus ATCC 38327]|uniref:Uncharacterized protein n=1 Tax=Allomyces macrogynus (strain ATCC 38327) TaxID=578462 RepID=A0A0L0SEG1_ALLM3|nr:hypothetical protein AMAG_18698 [Allomyces macrogynus ATCC 38327]|eukprot:KNE60837.1 hypothetical protein AMAG_18698 [Allomyces macrogynus ATCC 38327]